MSGKPARKHPQIDRGTVFLLRRPVLTNCEMNLRDRTPAAWYNCTMNLQFQVLDRTQHDVLPKLCFLKEQGFYLAGGTALALHIGHRQSVDLDFYRGESFDPQLLLPQFEAVAREVVLVATAEGTLILSLSGVEVSVFHYPYRLLSSVVQSEYCNLASILDIAAMKLIALAQRGIRRDFIDFYFILQHVTLSEVFESAKSKYPSFDPYVGLQGLTFFDDAERDSLAARGIVLFRDVSWEDVKRSIIAEVRKYREAIR